MLLNLVLGGAIYFINLFNIDLTDVFRMIEFKCAKYHTNLFKCFKDVVS